MRNQTAVKVIAIVVVIGMVITGAIALFSLAF